MTNVTFYASKKIDILKIILKYIELITIYENFHSYFNKNLQFLSLE